MSRNAIGAYLNNPLKKQRASLGKGWLLLYNFVSLSYHITAGDGGRGNGTYILSRQPKNGRRDSKRRDVNLIQEILELF